MNAPQLAYQYSGSAYRKFLHFSLKQALRSLSCDWTLAAGLGQYLLPLCELFEQGYIQVLVLCKLFLLPFVRNPPLVVISQIYYKSQICDIDHRKFVINFGTLV